MKYEIENNRIKVTAEASDQWIGVTTSDGYVSNGMITCGRVKVRASGKRVSLRIKLTGKPDLAALVDEIDMIDKNTVEIVIGLADFGETVIRWRGDLRQQDAAILDQMSKLLESRGEPADGDALYAKLQAARNPAPRQSSYRESRGAGWCNKCQSYCFGDCQAH